MNRTDIIDRDIEILKANQAALDTCDTCAEQQKRRDENIKIYAVYAYDRAVRRGQPKSLRSCWELANTSADPHCQWWSWPSEEIKELTYQLSSSAGISRSARREWIERCIDQSRSARREWIERCIDQSRSARREWIERCIEQHTAEPTQFTAYAINARAEKLEQFRTLMETGY